MKEIICYELLYGDPFSRRDFRAVSGLLKQLAPDMDALTKERYLATIASGTVIVARIPNGKIVAVASIITIVKLYRIAYSVEDVIVDKKWRGRGIGREIMEKVIWCAEKLGMDPLDLHTARPFAAELYEKLGFQKRSTQPYRLDFKDRSAIKI